LNVRSREASFAAPPDLVHGSLTPALEREIAAYSLVLGTQSLAWHMGQRGKVPLATIP